MKERARKASSAGGSQGGPLRGGDICAKSGNGKSQPLMGGGHFSEHKGPRQDSAWCVGETARRPLWLERSERGRGEAEARGEQRPWRWQRWGGGPTGLQSQPRSPGRRRQAVWTSQGARLVPADTKRHTRLAFPDDPEIRGPQNSVEETSLQAKGLQMYISKKRPGWPAP